MGVLNHGGKLVPYEGPPICAVWTGDELWLKRVTRVTPEDSSGTVRRTYWAGKAELPRPPDLEEVVCHGAVRENVLSEVEKG